MKNKVNVKKILIIIALIILTIASIFILKFMDIKLTNLILILKRKMFI